MRAPGIAVHRPALGDWSRDRSRSSHGTCCLHRCNRCSASRWRAPCLFFSTPRRGCALVGIACGANNLHQQRRRAGEATRTAAAPGRVRDAPLQGRARLQGLDASRTADPAGRDTAAKTTEQRELLRGKQTARVLADDWVSTALWGSADTRRRTAFVKTAASTSSRLHGAMRLSRCACLARGAHAADSATWTPQRQK
jgi:hypothetical protein